MTTEQWEHENQDTLMEYFIDGDPSVRRIQCEHCRKIIYTQTRNRKYCSFQTCGHKMLNLRKSMNIYFYIFTKKSTSTMRSAS